MTNEILSPIEDTSELPEENKTDITPQSTDSLINETTIIPIVDSENTGITIPPMDQPQPEQPPIDAEMCSMIYETLFNMASSLINKDNEVELPPARIKTQGKLLSKLFEKYNFNNDNMDAIMFLMGCALDYQFVKKSGQDEEVN